MRIKFLASVTAALALAFIPTTAQAVQTTLDVQNGGSAAVDLVSGDTLDVTVQGPIAKTGPATHELYATWSKQSLRLIVDQLADPAVDITWPEGWTLEYTTDGTHWIDWSVTAPTNRADIIAIRSLGDVNTVGENTFKTTSTGSLYAASFAGSGNGDGFDVAVGNGMVFNMYHHNTSAANIECHTYGGDPCDTPVFTLNGYWTNQGSRVFFDEASSKVYAFVYNSDGGNYGTICVDYSDPTAVSCGYTILDSQDSAEENQGYGSQSEDNGIIWSITGNDGKLMCLNLATGTACDDNGWSTGLSESAQSTGRVTALGGKVYYTLEDQMGCYDPATNGRCNGSSTVTLSSPSVRHSPVPLENTSGVVVGACDLSSRQCIDTNGATLAFPSALGSFWDTNPPDIDNAGDNMAQWGYGNHRFYYDNSEGAGAIHDWASNNVSCYDYLTQAACAGFDGNGREGLESIYATIYDPSTPNCLWVNQDSGRIVPLNVETGEVGCVMGNPVVSLPYDAITPRMSCNEDGRVTQWSNIVVAPLTGMNMSDVRVSFYDSNGDAVSGYTNLTPNASGLIDLTGLDVNATGTQPTIRITGGDITPELAQQISATVTFVAEDPQLCFALDAGNYCETTITNSPAPGDIADGILYGTSITRPTSGTDVGNTATSNLPGQNAAQMCASSALVIPLPALAETGFDSSGLGLAGFAILAAGVGAVAATRRRKV